MSDGGQVVVVVPVVVSLSMVVTLGKRQSVVELVVLCFLLVGRWWYH